MTRISLILVAGSLLLSACLPAFIQPAGTQVPQPTLPLEDLPTQTSEPTAIIEPTATSLPTTTSTAVTETSTPIEITLESFPTSTVDSLTGTLTSTPPEGTDTPALGGYPTSTPTDLMVTRQAGGIPAGTKYAQIKLINKSKRQTYISLHWHYDDKTIAYFEYPVSGTVSDKIPTGRYTYVAWVGGKKMTGSFHMNSNNGVTIVIYKDRIVIQN